jgi:hypothetical protein
MILLMSFHEVWFTVTVLVKKLFEDLHEAFGSIGYDFQGTTYHPQSRLKTEDPGLHPRRARLLTSALRWARP